MTYAEAKIGDEVTLLDGNIPRVLKGHVEIGYTGRIVSKTEETSLTDDFGPFQGVEIETVSFELIKVGFVSPLDGKTYNLVYEANNLSLVN